MIDQSPSPTRRARTSSAKAILLLLSVFAAGNLTGIGGTLVVMLKRLQENVRHPEAAAGPANRILDRAERVIAKDLDLTADERRSVREEFSRTRARLEEIRTGVIGDFRELANDTVRRISARLPVEKRGPLLDHARDRLDPWGVKVEP